MADAKKNVNLTSSNDDKVTINVAHQVLGGTATSPALFIDAPEGKIYLNGKAKPDADGNVIGKLTASKRTVDSMKTPGTTITAYWADSFQPASLAIKQADNDLKLSELKMRTKVLTRKTEALESMVDVDLFAISA